MNPTLSTRRLRFAFALLLLAGMAPGARALPADWTGAALSRPQAWRRPEPAPQGRMGIQERPSGQRGLVSGLWRSALLPGWGQRYLGAPGRGLIFMGAEAATWGTYTSFKVQEHLRADDYIEMAQVFAGVAGGDHPDDYWKAVGQNASWQDYNEWLRYQARREYGFGTSEYDSYIAEHEIDAADAWDWNSDDRRVDYLLKRKASNNAGRRATYTLYALLVNRVVCLVDTWRVYRSREAIRSGLETDRASLQFGAAPRADGLALSLRWTRCF